MVEGLPSKCKALSSNPSFIYIYIYIYICIYIYIYVYIYIYACQAVLGFEFCLLARQTLYHLSHTSSPRAFFNGLGTLVKINWKEKEKNQLDINTGFIPFSYIPLVHMSSLTPVPHSSD
jgi:hypothetical protein